MMNLFAQIDRLNVLQRAVRDHFREGGSIPAAVAVLLVVVGIVFLVKLLAQRAQKKTAEPPPDEPHELFKGMLDELDLTPAQQKFLKSVAADLDLKNPAVLVLCPALFDRHMAAWKERGGADPSAGPDIRGAGFVARLRAHLFPATLTRVSTEQLRLQQP